MKRLNVSILLTGLACVLGGSATLAQPHLPDLPHLPAPLHLPSLDDFLSGLPHIDDARQRINELTARANEARSAGQKRVEDFVGCPSKDAQALYDRIKTLRDEAEQKRSQAESWERSANDARHRCNEALGPVCDPAFNQLPFTVIKDAAEAAVRLADAALAGLRVLKCPVCSRRGPKIDYPIVELAPANVGLAPAPEQQLRPDRVVLAQSAKVSQSLTFTPPAVTFCSKWDPGTLTVEADGGNGELGASIRAKLPRCTSFTSLGAGENCSSYDIKLLLPELKRLRIVPPQVLLGDVSVQIGSKKVPLVHVGATSCAQPVNICTQARANFMMTLDTSRDPLSQLQTVAAANCTRSAVVGCALPPFGIQAGVSTVDIPDPAHSKITIRTDPRFKPGGIEVDLTRPELRVMCNRNGSSYGLPSLHVKMGTIDLPYLCSAVVLRGVVALP